MVPFYMDNHLNSVIALCMFVVHANRMGKFCSVYL